jgi:membrane-associated phospholipid phosphatase
MTRIERPDGSSYNSSLGHTANAFASAEFLWQEYKDVSIWYGISGYIIASGTGVLRIYNNRHWLTDVAAGAGIDFMYQNCVLVVSKMQNLL